MTLGQQIFLGLFRQALQAVAVALITAGVVTAGQGSIAVAAVMGIVGALISLGSIIAQWRSSRAHAQATAVVQAVEAHPSLSLGVNAAGKPTVAIKVPFQDNGPTPSLSTTGNR